MSLGLQAWQGTTDDATFHGLKSELESKRDDLLTLIETAELQGINVDYAYVSQVVIERFLIYSQFDRANPNLIQDAVDALWWGERVEDNYSTTLAFEQLADSIELADSAIEELQAQIDGNIQLADPVDFSQGSMSISDGEFLLDGKPVFPSSFIWMPSDIDTVKAFGNMGGVYYSVNELREGDSGVSPWAISSDIDSLASQDIANMAPQVFFLGYNGAAWMKEQFPELWEVGRNFVPFDIDSPLIRSWYRALFEGYMPEVSISTDTLRIHLLANEPHFATREGGWLAENGLSENSMLKYQAWLEDKYSNDIQALNSAYGATHADFSAAKEAMPVPVPKSLQGGAQWYDWCRFNMARVTNWFQFLADGTQEHDVADSPVTIKLLGGQLVERWRDHGMDMEALVKLQGVLGSDFTLGPHDLLNINMSAASLEWRERYAMDWREQSMGLDFAKSIAPGKPFYDSEWHGLSGKWQHFDMDPAYVRSALWLAINHGMNAVNAWVWGRRNDGDMRPVNSIFVSEPTTQPLMMDAFGRTMKELNAHAERFSYLAADEREVYFYYLEDSAIQDLSYIESLVSVYEAVKLLNVQVGFTTPSEISTLSNDKLLIVSPSIYASQSALDALASFDGKAILVNEGVSFSKTELGLDRTPVDFDAWAELAFSDVLTMYEQLEGLIRSELNSAYIDYQVLDMAGEPSWGVFVRQYQHANTGQVVLSLINIAKGPRQVVLNLPNGVSTVQDLIYGKDVNAEIELDIYGVSLLQIEPELVVASPQPSASQGPTPVVSLLPEPEPSLEPVANPEPSMSQDPSVKASVLPKPLQGSGGGSMGLLMFSLLCLLLGCKCNGFGRNSLRDRY
ncbi:beta-galactosidase [Agaribacterium sp. ZY112]|uniref:beta-galactosidase n=1 Tax=Agaribacterium sp. ZY112 TaxID=3233574 RepID=UPI0035231AC5